MGHVRVLLAVVGLYFSTLLLRLSCCRSVADVGHVPSRANRAPAPAGVRTYYMCVYYASIYSMRVFIKPLSIVYVCLLRLYLYYMCVY